MSKPDGDISSIPAISAITASIAEIFGEDGPLAASLSGYEMRPEQVTAAETIEQAMVSGSVCLVEAGTGVGKSLAYLVPAIRRALQHEVTVVSTHTLGLQAQLIEKDIPLALSLIPGAQEEVKPWVLKGRGNYVCPIALQNGTSDLLLSSDPLFARVRKWANAPSCSGDLADLPFTFPMTSEISSTPETCRGSECTFYNSCPYYNARRGASESRLIVVNHALFLSDLALRGPEGFGIVIPPYQHVVIDEAHHLETVATKSFGVEFASNRLKSLVDKIRRLKNLEIADERLEAIEHLNGELFQPMFTTGRQEFTLNEALTNHSANFNEQVGAMCNALNALQNELQQLAKNDETKRDTLDGFAKLTAKAKQDLEQICGSTDEDYVRWGTVSGMGRRESAHRATLCLTPVSVTDKLQTALWNSDAISSGGGSASLISATLADAEGFHYVKTRLGLTAETTDCVLGSPFNFKENALLYVPAHLPEPPKVPNESYTQAVTEEVVRLVTLTQGRTFVLFTSRKMLDFVAHQLAERVEYPIFKQGDAPPARLLEDFRSSGNGVLLGVQTFWEGVDVRGDALSCVIIDRIPFAVPDSPVNRARTQAITDAGGDWFKEYAVPTALMRLKQGFGRLIRTKTDKGIVCILDTRLLTRGYGAEFVKFLPPASRASKWHRVEQFWHRVKNETEG